MLRRRGGAPATSPADFAGALPIAAKLFLPHHTTSGTPAANLVSWTSLVSAAARSGDLAAALRLLSQMSAAGLRPNEYALGSALSACAGQREAAEGGRLHCSAVKAGLETNRFVGGALLHLYARCGAMDAAGRLFGRLVESGAADVACWNVMVGGYARDGRGRDGMGVVGLMRRLGLVLDGVTFVEALTACSVVGSVRFAEIVHGLVVKVGFDCVPLVANSFISFYFKNGVKVSALQVFDELGQRDVVSWNAVLSGLAKGGDVEETLKVFDEMMRAGLKPNRVGLSILIRMCGGWGELRIGIQLFAMALRLGLVCDDALVVGAVVGMFSRCGVMESARLVFDRFSGTSVIVWNEVIYGYAVNGCSIKSFELFCMLLRSDVAANEVTYSNLLAACSSSEHGDMSRQIHCCTIKAGYDSNGFVGSSLINAYARAGEVCSLKRIFQNMKVLDAASWGSMISALSQLGCHGEALVTFNRFLKSGGKTDEYMLSSLLSACATASTAYSHTRCIHTYVIKSGLETYPCVASSMIDAYAKCGDISSSKMTFDSTLHCRDPIMLNSMITSYAQHGFLMEATNLFEKMELAEMKPSNATFVSIISACGHLGLVDQGRKFFNSISSRCGIPPSKKNYGCLIDMYARSGFLKEAQEVIAEMPFEPWPAVYRSLLNGCRIHGNSQLAELAVQNLLRLEPKNDAGHLLLMNIYAENERWEDVSMVKAMMKQKEVRKETSYSRIEV